MIILIILHQYKSIQSQENEWTMQYHLKCSMVRNMIEETYYVLRDAEVTSFNNFTDSKKFY